MPEDAVCRLFAMLAEQAVKSSVQHYQAVIEVGTLSEEAIPGAYPVRLSTITTFCGLVKFQSFCFAPPLASLCKRG